MKNITSIIPCVGRLDQLPPEQREKAIGDVFCIRCQKAYRLETFEEREFRGNLMIEGKCPVCGETLIKPVGELK
jgi:hypothetical protein